MSASAGQSLVSWVEATFPLGEVLAVGGLLPDGSTFHHGATAEFASCMDGEVWTSLADALKQLAAGGCDGERTTWDFENAMLWTAVRVDGSYIGVFTERNLSDENRASIASRLESFLALS
jgi:hypothetical protein